MRTALVDIGELGWSLYLSAHARYLIEKEQKEVVIVTFPERFPLYEFVHETISVPNDFYPEFGQYPKQCLGLYGSDEEALRDFFLTVIPKDSQFPDWFRFNCIWNFQNKTVYKPYPISILQKPPLNRRILMFPRFRSEPVFSWRNLSKRFWINLGEALSETFLNFTITAVGTKDGAYDLKELEGIANFENLVGRTKTVQSVIDLCGESVGAVGSASSLPKLSLLQQVPTFTIGHEKQRCEKENVLGTRFGFYEVDKDGYGSLPEEPCTTEVIHFFQGKKP